jgi:hypothetical protein
MNSIGNFQNICYFRSSVAKAKTSSLPLHMCFALFNGDFFMDLYSVDIDEAMKRGNEALNASSLQFCK